MSRYPQRIVIHRSNETRAHTFELVLGCDPPTGLFFAQISGERAELREGEAPLDDDVQGDPRDEVLLMDSDCATVDELERVLREQRYFTFAEACEAFGQPFESADGPWINAYGRKRLEDDQAGYRASPPPVAARALAEQIMPGRLLGNERTETP